MRAGKRNREAKEANRCSHLQSAGKLLGSVQLTKCSSSLHACSPDETRNSLSFIMGKPLKPPKAATQPQNTTKLFGVAGVRVNLHFLGQATFSFVNSARIHSVPALWSMYG